jgi:G3E family GTPase
MSAMCERVPATVIAGFLGSGKTTLLNRLLSGNLGLRFAVIVNEFGEVGVDGALVSGGELFVELDNGCLCCALNQNLEELLLALKDRGDFDHLLVETTGLADPLPVGWTFQRAGLSDFYRLDAVITLVDAVNVAKTTAVCAEAGLQIEQADLLMLNKLDLVADGGAGAESVVRSFNAASPLLRTSFGSVSWDVLLSSLPAPRIPPPVRPAHRAEHSPFETWHFESPLLLDRDRLDDFFFELPASVYRVKGIVRTGNDVWLALHAVGGRFDVSEVQPRKSPTRSRIVFIGQDLDRGRLAQLCRGLERSG